MTAVRQVAARPPRRAARLALVGALAAGLAPSGARAADEPGRETRPAASPSGHDERLMRLGDHFLEVGQHYRAVGAFEELRLFTRDERVARRASLKIAAAYVAGHRHPEAVRAYDQVLARHRLDETTMGWVRLFRAMARADGHFQGSARVAIPDLVADLDQLAVAPTPFGLAARQQQVRLLLAVGDRARAERLHEASTGACRAAADADCGLNEALAHAFTVPRARRRSPALASLFSALLPGLGAVYTEHYVDAIYYFGLTAAPAAMAWEVRRPAAGASDQPVTVYLLGAVAATFYLASIAQGWLGAHRFNAAEAHGYETEILRVTAADPSRWMPPD
jgi:hypothetical protein